MRIPVFTADWPTGFNKFSKYLGRHWPTSPLPMREAREVSASLLGYKSVHEIQQELIDLNDYTANPQKKPLDFDRMVNSICLRGLNRCGVDPLIMRTLIRKSPWSELAVWKLTNTYAIQQWEKQNAREGRLLIHDEYHRFTNYKTNNNLISLFDQAEIPHFDYAVTKDGMMYRTNTLERLLNSVELSEDSLADIGFEGTIAEFVKTRILPLAWAPVESCLGEARYTGEWVWDLPYLHKLDLVGDNRYTIRHLGFNAHYPGIYSHEDLGMALSAIYRGQTIPTDNNDGIDRHLLVVGEQSFFEASPLQSYGRFLSHSNFTQLGIPAMIGQIKPTITHWPVGIDKSTYRQHLKIRKWFGNEAQLSVKVKMATSDEVGVLLADLFNGHRSTIETLKAKGYLSLPERDTDNGESTEEDKQELLYEIDQYHHSGLSVLTHYPELNPYFDTVALGHAYNQYESEYRSIYNCYSRSVGFLIYVVEERLRSISGTRLRRPKTIPAVIYSALLKNECSINDAVETYTLSCELFEQFCSQETIIDKMETFAAFAYKTRNLKFTSVGHPYKPTRQSAGESMGELLKLGRKFSIKPILATQDISLTGALVNTLFGDTKNRGA